jgi:hypothetical protein
MLIGLNNLPPLPLLKKGRETAALHSYSPFFKGFGVNYII